MRSPIPRPWLIKFWLAAIFLPPLTSEDTIPVDTAPRATQAPSVQAQEPPPTHESFAVRRSRRDHHVPSFLGADLRFRSRHPSPCARAIAMTYAPMKAATNFQSVRFHGVFMDEVGLYDPDRKTQEIQRSRSASGE